MTNTLLHSRRPLKNHNQFQFKMGKIYTRFGATRTYMAYIREYPRFNPPPAKAPG